MTKATGKEGLIFCRGMGVRPLVMGKKRMDAGARLHLRLYSVGLESHTYIRGAPLSWVKSRNAF